MAFVLAGCDFLLTLDRPGDAGVDGDGDANAVCDHDCRGGACVAGVCQPVTLVADAQRPVRLALSDTDVYWVDRGAGLVMRTSKDGAGQSILRQNEPGVLDIALDAGNVYWATPTLVQSCSILGACGPVVPYAGCSTAGETRLAVSPSNVYWTCTANEQIFGELKIQGNQVQFQKAEPSTGEIVADAGAVVWARTGSGGEIRSSPADQTPNPTTFAELTDRDALALDTTFVVAAGHAATEITAVDRDTKSMHTIAQATNVTAIAIDNGTVFWVSDGPDAALRSCPVTGGNTQPATILDNLDSPTDVAVDANFIYFATAPTNGPGTIQRVARP